MSIPDMPPIAEKGEYINYEQTTTHRLKQAVSNNLLQIERVEICNKDTGHTKVIEVDTFKESMDFVYESIFADCIGWHFEKNHESDGYITECGRLDGNVENIVSVYLRVNDGANVEDIERILKIEEA